MSKSETEVNEQQTDKKPDATDRLETARHEMSDVVDKLTTSNRKVFVRTDTKKFLNI